MTMKAGYYRYVLRLTLLAVICLLTSSTFSFSQDYIFDVDFIGVENGLPHRNTYALAQDKEGYIWVTTLAGISRYDGYTFKTWLNAELDIPELLAAQHLAVDFGNRLWYSLNTTSPNSGLIDSRRDSIYTMEAISRGRFTSKDVVYVGNSKATGDDVIIALRNGIIYNYDGEFTEIFRAPSPFLESVFCEALPDGSYWLVHSNYVNPNYNEVFRIKNGKIVQRLKPEYGIKRIASPYPDLILEMPKSPKANHWILEKDTLLPYRLKGDPSKDVTALLQFYEEYSCYATGNEILVQDHQGNTIYTFNAFKSLNYESPVHCYETILDQQNILWVTAAGGLLKIRSRRNPFTHIGPEDGVRGMYKDGGQLWLSKFIENTVSGEMEAFWSNSYVSIMTFYKDDREQLWIGTDVRKLIKYVPDTDIYVHYDYKFDTEATSLHLMFQNALTRNYWLGTDKGILSFNPATQKLTPFPLPIAPADGVYIRQFYQNKTDIWIVSNKGIFLMDAATERIVKHYSTTDGLPINNLNHLYEDSEGIFWLGAKGGGLIRWDRATNTFLQYTREDGLSNNNIYAVYEDDYGTLWLPSDYGLMAFDKNTATNRVYLPQHGIAHEEFNTFGHFRDKDGTLYFGGLGGVTSFHPKDLRGQATVSPPLYATKVQVLENNTEEYTDKTSEYRGTKKIRLNPDDRILEVELTLLDYEQTTENQYAYKLKGQQEQWIYTTDNKLSIINPPYGRYDLVIKARGASGQWSDDVLTIPVHVPLPFYRQWWFILSLVLITVAIIIIAVRWRVRKLEKDRKSLEAEVKKRTRKIAAQAEELQELDRAKSRFFTNITHEFRTPLTLISGPAEQMIAAGVPQSLKARAQTIKHNAKHLLGLINQLLDISKLESGQMEIKASTADIVAFSRDLVGVFESRAAEKQQQLRFYAETEAWETHFDTEKLSEIIYNLLSNAIKYSPEKAVIALSLSKTEMNTKEHIKIEVKDTGTGISPEALPRIFDRFYQADDSTTRKGQGTGIGLALVKELVELMSGEIIVESHLGKGSAFTVLLPVLSPPLHPDAAVEGVKPRLPKAPLETKTDLPQSPDQDTSAEDKLELLIVEDHAGMREYIRSCIDESVYRITEAADGEEGIEKAREIIPDLIISDVMMPKKDGFALTRAIRDHVATSHIPLILLTAKSSEESRLEGLGRGADAYLTKPFSPKELNLRIKKLIELRKLLQSRYQGRNRELPQADPVFQKEDVFISELKNYISENISKPHLSTTQISSHFVMSRMQLHRKLKSLTNTSVGDFVRTVRLDIALELLKTQELDIAQIAYETGFSTPSNFSKAFKKAYGKTPSAFRQ